MYECNDVADVRAALGDASERVRAARGAARANATDDEIKTIRRNSEAAIAQLREVASWATRVTFDQHAREKVPLIKNKLTPMAMMLNELANGTGADEDEIADARQGLKEAVEALDALWHLASGSSDEVQRLINEPDEGV